MFNSRKVLAAVIFIIALYIFPVHSASAQSIDSAPEFRIVQITDTHIYPDCPNGPNLQAVINEINNLKPAPDFVVCTGDFTTSGFKVDYDVYMKEIKSLKIPIYHTFGNHDIKWSEMGKSGLKRYFNEKPYYSFNHKGVHFVILDSTMPLEHNGIITPEQLKWLDSDLRHADRKTPIVLCYHHCRGYITNEYALQKTIKPYNVRLTLTGHEHTWGGVNINGIPFVWTQAVQDNPPSYKIVDFYAKDIKTYRKAVGKDPELDGTYALVRPESPIKSITPASGTHVTGNWQASVEVSAPVKKMEIGIDGVYKQADAKNGSTYTIDMNDTQTSGQHMLSVRATDMDGEVWEDYAPVAIGNTDREVWRFQADGAVQRPVTIADGRVYFGCTDGSVYCLNASSGRKIWKTRVDSMVLSQVAVCDNLVYLGTMDGTMVALDAGSGKKVWSKRLGGAIQASPVAANGVVYIAAGDPAVYALNAANGRLIWKTSVGAMVQAKPIIVHGRLIFGCWDTNVYALDILTGKQLWKTGIVKYWAYSPANCDPSTDGRDAYLTTIPMDDSLPDLVSLDVMNGSIKWSIRNPGRPFFGLGSVTVSGSDLYAANLPGDIFKLSAADGKEIWRTTLGQDAYACTPVVENDTVYAGSIWGEVSAFDLQTGKKFWSYSTGRGYLFASPVSKNGNIYISSLDGSVTCIKADK